MSTPASTPSETSEPHTKNLYKNLHTTAFAFIESLGYSAHSPAPTHMNIPLILSLRTNTYTHSFGHNYFISTAPPLQGTYTLDEFIAHLTRTTSMLESWQSEVRDICVDEAKRMVVARAGFWMKVKGEEAVENDLVWWLWMDGEGRKVERSIEFLDGVATKKLKKLMDGVAERS
ncbi:hypothetical protein P280DRAFT_472237 [Massarina eburnea CBS 473.64]|uniref:Uncharacterized protein n=1 Tax=Massarina eburnea CBS 473.64 TaxID=1395130 RepID=A0A6A6RQ82_9PLEO|nr:hypothetical protein P280DRAFT_472237 [Massarina eburnea CBS 473.64]